MAIILTALRSASLWLQMETTVSQLGCLRIDYADEELKLIYRVSRGMYLRRGDGGPCQVRL
jgi:hypothetical protein